MYNVLNNFLKIFWDEISIFKVFFLYFEFKYNFIWKYFLQ